MRYVVHVYTPVGEFAQFLLGYRDLQFACEAGADHLVTRPGYRAEVHGREAIGKPATLFANITPEGIINYANVQS